MTLSQRIGIAEVSRASIHDMASVKDKLSIRSLVMPTMLSRLVVGSTLRKC